MLIPPAVTDSIAALRESLVIERTFQVVQANACNPAVSAAELAGGT
jgi:hypothetical protein